MTFKYMLKQHMALDISKKLLIRHIDGREGVVRVAGIDAFFVEFFPIKVYTERTLERVPYELLSVIGTWPKEDKKKTKKR